MTPRERWISRRPLRARGFDDAARRRSSRTAVTRSTAGPTAAFQANVDLAGRERRAAQQLDQRTRHRMADRRIGCIDASHEHVDPIIRGRCASSSRRRRRAAPSCCARPASRSTSSPSTSTSGPRRRSRRRPTCGGWRRRSRPRRVVGRAWSAARRAPSAYVGRSCSAPTRPSSSTATILGKPRDDADAARDAAAAVGPRRTRC